MPTHNSFRIHLLNDRELDARIDDTARRLDADSALLEAALDERDRRGSAPQLALTAAAITYLAVGETTLATGGVH